MNLSWLKFRKPTNNLLAYELSLLFSVSCSKREEGNTQMFGFIKCVDEGRITSVKDLESGPF